MLGTTMLHGACVRLGVFGKLHRHSTVSQQSSRTESGCNLRDTTTTHKPVSVAKPQGQLRSRASITSPLCSGRQILGHKGGVFVSDDHHDVGRGFGLQNFCARSSWQCTPSVVMQELIIGAHINIVGGIHKRAGSTHARSRNLVYQRALTSGLSRA